MADHDRMVRLISIPPRHPYVDAVRPPGVVPVRPDRVAQFAPDPLFAPGALREVAAEADLVHLHFGFEVLDGASARRWLEDLRAAGLPLVLTVHDLRNPHEDRPERHDEVLAALVPGAATVITLTRGAAAEIQRRFGVRAQVLPHPTLVEPAASADVLTEPGLAVLHLKSLRRNLRDPERLVSAAARGAAAAGGRLRVDAHPELADEPVLLESFATVRDLGGEVTIHPRFDDRALERYLRRAQVSVLPHRWGTHSGWLELARDLGTRIVAPSGGYYAEQWPEVVGYVNDEVRGLHDSSLADAVAHALRLPPVAPADRDARLAQLEAVRSAHDEVYAAPVPPASVSPGSVPPGTVSAGSLPSGSLAPGSGPPDSLPPVLAPPGSLPPVAGPPDSLAPEPPAPDPLPPEPPAPDPLPPEPPAPDSLPPEPPAPDSLPPDPVPPGLPPTRSVPAR